MSIVVATAMANTILFIKYSVKLYMRSSVVCGDGAVAAYNVEMIFAVDFRQSQLDFLAGAHGAEGNRAAVAVDGDGAEAEIVGHGVRHFSFAAYGSTEAVEIRVVEVPGRYFAAVEDKAVDSVTTGFYFTAVGRCDASAGGVVDYVD